MGMRVKPIHKRRSNWAIVIGAVAQLAGALGAPIAVVQPVTTLAIALYGYFARAATEDAKAAAIEASQ